ILKCANSTLILTKSSPLFELWRSQTRMEKLKGYCDNVVLLVAFVNLGASMTKYSHESCRLLHGSRPSGSDCNLALEFYLLPPRINHTGKLLQIETSTMRQLEPKYEFKGLLMKTFTFTIYKISATFEINPCIL